MSPSIGLSTSTHAYCTFTRTPISSSALPNGYGYQNISLLNDSDSVSPLAAPQSSILIADLLP